MSSQLTITSSALDNTALHYKGAYGARVFGSGEFIGDVTAETASAYFTHHRDIAGKNVIHSFSFNRVFLSFDVPQVAYTRVESATLLVTTAPYSQSEYIFQSSPSGVRHATSGKLVSASIGPSLDVDDFQTVTASAGVVPGYEIYADNDLAGAYARDNDNDAYASNALAASTTGDTLSVFILNNKALNDINNYLLTGGSFDCAILEQTYDYNFRFIYPDYTGDDQFYTDRTFGVDIYTGNATYANYRPRLILQLSDPSIPPSVVTLHSGNLQVSSGSLIIR